MITAPYNFVPLNKKVFYPPWAEDISHDIPFSDGESGEIEITIEAKSPIFIRDHKNPEEFCNFINNNGAKEFYIPGSSLKGVIRSIMEIMSFAKLNFFDDKRFSVRDMTPTKYCLIPNRRLRDCPDNQRVELFNHDLVATANGIGLLRFNQDGTGTLIDYTVKTGNRRYPFAIRQIHYEELQDCGYENFNIKDNFLDKYKKIPPYTTIRVNPNQRGRRHIAECGGNEEAFVVCNNYIERKKYECILCECDRSDETITIPIDIMNNFKRVYFSDGDTPTHELGKFWRKQLATENGRKYGIPVFLKRSNNGNILAIGLTQIFKLPYSKSIEQAIEQDIQDKTDLTEAIFGYTKDKKVLKGRVQFSHFKATTIRFEASNYENQRVKEEVLGEPKPTYYPNYIEQTDIDGNRVNKYKTLMDEDAHISGRKRYPLRQTITTNPVSTNDDGVENENVATKFKPLDSGTTFKGKIRFHNLKPQEIGALISALTLHGNYNTHYLNLGMAKPLGYGKVKININTIITHKYSDNTIENREIEHYLKEFEKTMKLFEPNWLQSKQLKELFATTCANTNNDNKLVYQKLKNSRDKNDFVEDKKARKYLKRYSQWQNQGCGHNAYSLVNQDEMEKFKNEIDKKLEEILQNTIQKGLKETRYNPSDLCKYINDEELEEDLLFGDRS